ncbi:PEP-CTERM sorting domain-containing protein [uncultured Tateyamaria sp.]|uniref:PEP-CTERM sorting domain-containing protein n=1 Tax=uncultured Tateyamaria sp. TaxID=455651 RepID=UPI00262DEBB2|nr:PEP-CTERM sorting domain-containing protein [uncultured Tateyamaria sp.]
MTFHSKLTAFALAAFAFVANPAAAITYDIDLNIGNGSVTGFFETNGTLGVLAAGDFVAWELTLTAPNLWRGTPDVIGTTTASAGISFLETFGSGTATGVTASATQLIFDFAGNTAALFSGGDHGNYFCLQGENTGACSRVPNQIAIGFDAITGNAEEETRTGSFVFAEVAPSIPAVPLPASLPLLLAGLGLMGWMNHRKG